MVLQNKWRRLLKSFDIEEEITNDTWNKIAEAYSYQNRHYHNLIHIEEVLQIVENLNYQQQLDRLSLQFAGWLHDIVYDTQAHDNEEKSAAYARNFLSVLNIPDYIINNTCRLILTTKQHKASEEDIESQILLDADLAILGSNPKRYHEYMLSIRQEYAWVEIEEYKVKRTQVLQTFLQRAKIFSTPELHNQLEQQARNNIKNEMATDYKQM